jgi:hypothetical protein
MAKTKKSKAKRGRPTKWTKQYRDRIIKNLENGHSHKRAAILAGVGESTFHEWLKKGRELREEGKNNLYTDFAERVEVAEETYIAYLQQSVTRHSVEDGKLALEVLSRRRPHEWGRKDRITHDGGISITVKEDTEFDG